MLNEVIDTILKRSSIRKFTDEPLTPEQMAALKKAALASPTAMNAQHTRFIFVTDKSVIEKFDEEIMTGLLEEKDVATIDRAKSRGTILFHPPLLVVITNLPGEHYGDINAGIAVENLALAAKSLGLDSVILGMPHHAFTGSRKGPTSELLRFPEGYEYAIAIAIGNRAADKEPHAFDEAHIIEI